MDIANCHRPDTLGMSVSDVSGMTVSTNKTLINDLVTMPAGAIGDSAGIEYGENAEGSYPDLAGARLLLIDDDTDIHAVVGMIAEEARSYLVCVQTLAEAKMITARETFDIALVDMVLPDAGGADIISYLMKRFPLLSIIVVTGYADQKMAYQLESAGVQHVLTKPFTISQLRFTLSKELARRKIVSREGMVIPESSESDMGLVGNSLYIKSLRNKIALFSQSNLPVLICGPTGTGKEIIASAIHTLSARGKRPMMAVNSAAIPEHLEEAEFFGHARGAFTGAHEEKRGIIECAAGSTLFLDEVGELSLRMQAKLLRVLDGYGYMRVGESVQRTTDFRCISATNRPLTGMLSDGLFREDLYFRLKSGYIETLPLVAHKEDIPALVQKYLSETGAKESCEYSITGKALGLLLEYHWPGNVRELRNVVESLCVINRKTKTIVAESIEWAVAGIRSGQDCVSSHFSEAKAEFEKKYYINLLARYNGNISASAREAGIGRPNFSKKLKAMGIDAAHYRCENRSVITC